MKNIHEIREILCEEIDNLRSGKTTPKNANSIIGATGKILTSIKLEMDYAKLMGIKPIVSFLEPKKAKKKLKK